MRVIDRQTIISWIVAICAFAAGAADTQLAGDFQFEQTDADRFVQTGQLSFDAAGPREPEFPLFNAENSALRLEGGYLQLHPEDSAQYVFQNGDTISIEAWVEVNGDSAGTPMYIVGKGRSGRPEFARDNQNWALRLVGKNVVNLSFLFASAPGPGNAHWHRWTSANGIYVGSGWHHVAVRYTFGDPKTIRGWIDGKPTPGRWDMGGTTSKPPVNDSDTVWIGSALNGNAGSTFTGSIDNLRIHRGAISDEYAAAVFQRVGPPRMGEPMPAAMPDLGPLPKGRVLVSITEGFATHTRWPYMGEEKADRTAAFECDSFLVPRLPLHYDEIGIRDAWDAPLLVRIAADVRLRDGEHTFLMRARSLGRLWVDSKLVAETEALSGPIRNGEEPVTPLAEPPVPGARVHGYGMQEVVATAKVTTGGRETVRIVMEVFAGGDKLRTQLGETCVAVLNDEGDGYTILSAKPEHAIPLTDDAVLPVIAMFEDRLHDFDDARRREAAKTMDPYWDRRHDAARSWASADTDLVVPAVEDGAHPIDAFIQAKIGRALEAAREAQSETGQLFHNEVLPILEEACFRCHGEKDKGGLRLNSREAMLAGGDSGWPALVPGDPASSEIIARVTSEDEDDRMPPTDLPLSNEELAAFSAWVEAGAPWPGAAIREEDVAFAPIVDDYAFIRRVYIDTVGVPPTPEEVRSFVADTDPKKRDHIIDTLLLDERIADNWMGFWQDLLAENPTLINAALNSTGPFRWFIYDSLRDDKPIDRMVTELIMMRGGAHQGGSAGFSLAAENDAPFAAKGHILASAFLGIELQCARCHDAPYHSATQRDLFSIAAMLNRKPTSVPESSAVPKEFFSTLDREPLIQVTLDPGVPVEPAWPFIEETNVAEDESIDRLVRRTDDSRERLAVLITSPKNDRFARVMVNRVWKRLIGAGIVEPVHDWEGREPSHPDLLNWLARELISNDYDMKHVMRLIMTSEAYQRNAVGDNLATAADRRFFNTPDARRMTAEQIVDSLHATTERAMDAGRLTFVYDGRLPLSQRMDLGEPTRAWMFASLANERDRPSLSLPQARSIADVLEAFGWRGERQKPVYARDPDPNVLQPGVLANGTLTASLTRAADGSAIAELAVGAVSPKSLVDDLFLRILSRPPTAVEREAAISIIAHGFAERIVPNEGREAVEPLAELKKVTWFNHLQSEANTIQLEWERRVHMGPPADVRLQTSWREGYEDVVWSLVNHPEFVWIP